VLTRTLNENVVLETELAPGLYPVLADPGQMELALVNLAVNAREAMPGGGTLLVRTRNVEVKPGGAGDLDAGDLNTGGLVAGRYACATVSDTGIGMSRHVMDHAFDPFFTTKPRGQGTGLGLPTVYGIVTQAGGRVTVRSERGAGTTFTILLPATTATTAGKATGAGTPDDAVGAAEAQENERRLPPGGGETVLVVEDEPAILRVVQKILSRNNYRVIAVADPREAARMATEHPGGIDVLLTDVIMPHLLGKEVADQIRAGQPGVKVLFMSGYTQGLLDSEGVLGDGVHLIGKPFAEAALLAKLREVIAGDAG